jgi:hypothetical protein
MNDSTTYTALMLVQDAPDATIALVQVSPSLNVAMASTI